MEKVMTAKQRAEAYKTILNKQISNLDTEISDHNKKLSEDEIHKFIGRLSELEKEGVLSYAQQELKEAKRLVDLVADFNPQIRREYEMNSRFNDATKVIETIEKCIGQVGDTIVNRACLELIFVKYGTYFVGENLQQWLLRFSKEEASLPAIKVDPNARERSDRLVLLAILSSIGEATGNGFPFAKYVESHFGIKAFESAKSKNKEKATFKETAQYCREILKKAMI